MDVQADTRPLPPGYYSVFCPFFNMTVYYTFEHPSDGAQRALGHFQLPIGVHPSVSHSSYQHTPLPLSRSMNSTAELSLWMNQLNALPLLECQQLWTQAPTLYNTALPFPTPRSASDNVLEGYNELPVGSDMSMIIEHTDHRDCLSDVGSSPTAYYASPLASDTIASDVASEQNSHKSEGNFIDIRSPQGCCLGSYTDWN